MKRITALLLLICFGTLLLPLAGCAAPAPTGAPVVKTVEVVATQAPAPAATEAPAPATAVPTPVLVSTQAPAPATAVPTPIFENRSIELEWPAWLRLGESDVLRLALVPSAEGYTARAEFAEHTLESKEVALKHYPGYTLYGIARLDGVGFQLAPSGEQRRMIPVGEPVAWRWSLAPLQPGKQRLTLSLVLRWEPDPGTFGPVGESLVFDRGIDMDVATVLGLSRMQALWLGAFSLLLGGVIGVIALAGGKPRRAAGMHPATPNRKLVIEHSQDIPLSAEEQSILQALFSRYQRVILESEFLSGYSGARTLLALPIRQDGLADAATIVKISPRADALAEFQNYETYVKDRLPPVTARIQHPPVAGRGGRLAALQYTLIAEPGRKPRSLRQALLEKSDPAYLQQLMQTFGPHWWMQRQPYTFIMAQEYDRLLPPHWLVEPVSPGLLAGKPQAVLDENPTAELSVGEIVRIGDFPGRLLRPDGISWALRGKPVAGQAPLRIRWLSAQPPRAGELGRITAGRLDLLARWTANFERFDLPDPLEKLPALLKGTLSGTRSTIHGDLNLENILVGPGSLVWLIDFAQTREGHTLFDFAHLSVEIAAHILTPQCASPREFYDRLAAGDELLRTLEAISQRCLFDPAHPEEFCRSLVLTSLGALKYPNLSPLAKHSLYLLAAYYTRLS